MNFSEKSLKYSAIIFPSVICFQQYNLKIRQFAAQRFSFFGGYSTSISGLRGNKRVVLFAESVEQITRHKIT